MRNFEFSDIQCKCIFVALSTYKAMLSNPFFSKFFMASISENEFKDVMESLDSVIEVLKYDD